MSFRPNLATALVAAALFVALGGTAFAVADATQPRCKNGAVRGIAAVTAGATISGEWSGRKALFARTFNCTGGATQVRRLDTGVYEVRSLLAQSCGECARQRKGPSRRSRRWPGACSGSRSSCPAETTGSTRRSP
jgi:hypothetical protein